MTTTAPVSRRTALLGSIALFAGGAGMASSTASALAAPAKRGKKSTKKSTAPALPTSWKSTMFGSPTQSQRQGWIASYTELREYGAISTLGPKRLNECEGIVTFEHPEHPGESFSAKISRSVRLGSTATAATLVGDRGTRIPAHLSLVRTANPRTRALIVHIDGPEASNLRLPKAPIVADLAAIEPLSQLTAATAKDLLHTALHFSFSEEGPLSKLTIDQVKVFDGGRRAQARVRGKIRGTSVSGTWVGVARTADEGHVYLWGKLPA